MVLLWDLQTEEGLRRPATSEAVAEYVREAWKGLASQDAAVAYESGWKLAAVPVPAVGWLSQRSTPVKAADAVVLRRLVAELSDDRFAVREAAAAELQRLGELAVPTLSGMINGSISLDLRRRLGALVGAAERPPRDPEKVRLLRAVEVLERIGSEDARRSLERLAAGAPEARLTFDAKAALQRLAGPPPDR